MKNKKDDKPQILSIKKTNNSTCEFLLPNQILDAIRYKNKNRKLFKK